MQLVPHSGVGYDSLHCWLSSGVQVQGASELALHWLDCAAKQKHIGACTAYGRELLKKCDSRPLGCSHSLQLTETATACATVRTVLSPAVANIFFATRCSDEQLSTSHQSLSCHPHLVALAKLCVEPLLTGALTAVRTTVAQGLHCSASAARLYLGRTAGPRWGSKFP